MVMALFLFFSLQSYGQVYETTFEVDDNWGSPDGGGMGSYNDKTYTDGDWFFESTEAFRGGADESFGGSPYSFRDRGDFSVKNTNAISGMTGFSLQLRDWMLGSGVARDLNISYDGGDNWETVAIIDKAWFDEYQVYQEYLYIFPGGEQDFAADDFLLELVGGNGANSSRINIGQFVALGEMDAVATPGFSPNGGSFYTPVEVSISTATPGADIFYSMESDAGPWTDYVDPITVDETTTIWAYASAEGMDDSNVASAHFIFPDVTEVATLAELRDMPDDGTVYMYTGDAVIVAMDGFRNRKFIQDATAAILIDDQPGTITTEYDLYDVITDVVGKINIWNNMVRFQPEANAAPATENTPVDPVVFTIDNLTSDDQAKLIQLQNVTFINLDEDETFSNGANYTITDGENEMVFRTEFWNVDYIGEIIPDTPLNITGVIIQFEETMQIVARFADDMEDYEDVPEDPDDLELVHFFFFGGDIPNNTPLESLESTFQQVESSLLTYHSALDGYPFNPDHPNWRKASLERRNAPTELNYRPEGNDDIPFENAGMRGIQVRQPFTGDGGENTVFLHLPTNGFEHIILRFAAKDQGDGPELMAVEELLIDYAVQEDGDWLTAGLAETSLTLLHEEFQVFTVNFSGIEDVNNNPDFVVRIRFDGPNLDLDDGDRVAFNNISLEGVPMDMPDLFQVTFVVEDEDGVSIDDATVTLGDV
ncbi:MAG: hypothetical protein EA394_11305, partial [Bacteroidia bacterium]